MDELDLNLKTIPELGINARRIALQKLQSSPFRRTPEFQEMLRLIKAIDSGKTFIPQDSYAIVLMPATTEEPETDVFIDPPAIDVLCDLTLLRVKQLRKIASENGLKGVYKMRKAELLEALQTN